MGTTHTEFGPGFGHQKDEAHESESHHAVPLWMLVAVFLALMVLTVITVAVTYVDLGAFNLLVAMLVAVVKAALVAAFFMHLWWDSPFNSLSLFAGLAFVGLFIIATIQDTAEYRPNVAEFESANPRDVMAQPSSVGQEETAEAQAGDQQGEQ